MCKYCTRPIRYISRYRGVVLLTKCTFLTIACSGRNKQTTSAKEHLLSCTEFSAVPESKGFRTRFVKSDEPQPLPRGQLRLTQLARKPISDSQNLEMDLALTLFIVRKGLSFRTLEDGNLWAAFNVFGFEFTKLTRKRFKELLGALHTVMLERVAARIEQAPYVSFTMDGCTLRNGVQLETVTCHYISADWKIQSFCIHLEQPEGLFRCLLCIR